VVPGDKNESLCLLVSTGHSSLKVGLSRLTLCWWLNVNAVMGLQTEELIFWDCKLYENQTTTFMTILSDSSKRE
jgi:hypothetical protein